MKKIKLFKTFIKTLFLTFFSFFMIFPAQGFSEYSIDEKTNIRVYETVSPSIVAIDADINEGISSGTGCIINGHGLILTSSHVVEGFKEIKITLYDGKSYTGKMVANNINNSDFALIKIKPSSSLNTIKFGDSSDIKVGQKVLAIGNPFGFNRTLTTGIISRVDKKRNKIQTDAAINPGSSGGPLLNLKGEVIGINQSIYNPDNNKSNIGIGFAVPVNMAKSFIEDVKKTNPDVFLQN
ncbi:MAG TPA: trypsin-like peptidase domain-containing protein [Candidatus Gastranaerophilales bacterium]|nr:trypsin-like peptidase domain-containing protein [Candidatus Gastranaerophilales bacterium]